MIDISVENPEFIIDNDYEIETIQILLSVFNNNNNNWFLYSAFSKLWSKCFTVYYYPGHRIQTQFCTQSALSPAFRPVAVWQARTIPTQPQFRSHPTGSPFNTWVESSNVDKVSCWRTKVRATVGFEPGLSAWESSGHTTIPRHLHNN